MYALILINFVTSGCRTEKVLFDSIQFFLEKGLSYLFKDHEIYYSELPSAGPFHALHYLWKQPINDDRSPEQSKLKDKLRSTRKGFYSRVMKKDIQQKLEYIGNIKCSQASFILKELLGGCSAGGRTFC